MQVERDNLKVQQKTGEYSSRELIIHAAIMFTEKF